MKPIATIALLSLALSSAAQDITVSLSPAHFAAVASLTTQANAARAQRLTEVNTMRDKALPPLTAAQAGLSPLTTAEVLLSLAAPAIGTEAKALADASAAAETAAALDAVRAIKTRDAACSAKASAAGLDPATVCK